MSARILLWAVMASYCAWVVHRAWVELNDEYVIQGLFRVYQPPREVAEGWLIDARTGGLLAEVRARYADADAVAVAVADAVAVAVAEWANHLKELGISSRPTVGAGGTPRLLFVSSGPWLQVGTFQGQPVVFDPNRGVILLADGALPLDVPALELLDVHEAPW